MQRKLILLILLLLLISVGIAVAQSSTNFTVHRSVMLSGGEADSANYSVTSVIGQPATGIGDNANYTVSAGFLHSSGANNTIWLPVILK